MFVLSQDYKKSIEMGARGGATKPPEEVALEHANLAACRLQELSDLQQAARNLIIK